MAFREHMRDRARELQRESSPAEVVFWGRVRDRRLGGFRFRRQQPMGLYVADFFCADAGVVVEIDGAEHGAVREKDAARDAYMEEQGLIVVRISASEYAKDADRVLAGLMRVLQERAGTKWDRELKKR